MPSFSALRKRLATSSVAFVASLIPQHALAHSSLPGIEGFYTGILHPFTSFDQLLALLGLGVMLGVGPKEWFARSWLAFAAFAGVGALFGSLGYVLAQASLWLLSIGFVSAAVTAIYPSGIFALSVLLSSLCGLFIGASSAPASGPLRDMVITALGSLIGANIALLFVGSGVNWLREHLVGEWSLVALRILAAWIATISISMMALALATR